jgi:hypothetical protein
VHNVNPVADADYGDATLALYKKEAGIWVAATDVDATKTVLDWEPHYNYEIIAGSMDLPGDLIGGVTDEWYLAVIGVPDYPPQYYGQVSYISEVNLEAVQASRIVSNGHATSYMPYQLGGAPGTNKLRFVFKHPAGGQKRFQILIEHFV